MVMGGEKAMMLAFKAVLVLTVAFLQVSTLPISERHVHSNPSPYLGGSYGGASLHYRPYNRYSPQPFSHRHQSGYPYSANPYQNRHQHYRSKPVFDPYTRRFKSTPSYGNQYDGPRRNRYRSREDYGERDYYEEDEEPTYYRERSEQADRDDQGGGRGSSGVPSKQEEEHDHDHEEDHDHNHEEDHDHDHDHQGSSKGGEGSSGASGSSRFRSKPERDEQERQGSASSGSDQDQRRRPNLEETRVSDSNRFRTKFDRSDLEEKDEPNQENRDSGSSRFRTKFDRDNLDQATDERQGFESSRAQSEYERNRQLFEQQRDARRQQGFGTDQSSNREFGGQELTRGGGQSSNHASRNDDRRRENQGNRFNYVMGHQANTAGGSNFGAGGGGASNFDQNSNRYQDSSSRRESQRFDVPPSSNPLPNQNTNQRRDQDFDPQLTFNLFGLDSQRESQEVDPDIMKFHYDKKKSLQMAQEAEKRDQDIKFFNIFGDNPLQFERSDSTSNNLDQPSTTTNRPITFVEPKPSVFIDPSPGAAPYSSDNFLGTPSAQSPFQQTIDDRESCPTEPNWEINGKKYLVTALEPRCPHMSWSDALDFCRKSARMQAVSFQLEKRRQQIQAIMNLIMNPETKMDAFWTAGVVTHPLSDRDPILVEWSTGKEEVRPGTKYWARTGLSGLAQPDNYNYRTNPEEGLDEACAAVHRDATGQPKLHDELCAQKYPVVCETSYAMPGDMMGGMLS